MALRVVQVFLLALWTAFFIWLLTFGQTYLARLLHPRLWWLLFAGAGITMVFLLVTLSRCWRGGPLAHISLRWQWPSLMILLLPMLYVYPLGTARLDSNAFNRLATRTNGGFAQGELIPESLEVVPFAQEGSEGQRDISLTRLYAQQKLYLGKSVEVVCQLLKDDALPEGLSICYRFTIFCCAADARPVFVFLNSAQSLAQYATDDWLRVQGFLSVHEHNGLRTLQIQPEHIQQVEEPLFPFVF